MLVQKVYCIDNKSDQLLLDAGAFIAGPLSILWHNNGLFGLIPQERIRNDLIYLADLEKIEGAGSIEKTAIIYSWDDIITVKKLL